MGPSGGSTPPPDYAALARQQADIDKQANQQNTIANRPTQIGLLGSVDWALDPTTGRWIQKETLDPRIKAIQDQAIAQQGQQMGQLSKLNTRDPFKTVSGATEYDSKTGDAYSKMFTQNLLARVTPQQQIDKQQMETKLRLQGLVPGSEAYNRAYQNLLTSQGDVNAKAQLEGMLAGGAEARANYQTQMQGQQQRNAQSLQEYMMPYQTAGQMQDLTAGSWGAYMPSYQGYGTSQGSPGADMMGAAQSQYAAQVQQATDRAARRQAQGSGWGALAGAAVGTYFGQPQAGAAVGGAAGGYLYSDADLKDRITVIPDEDAYNAMQRIQPHSFVWPSGQRAAGLIAQEVAKEFPHLVRSGDQGYLMVDYEAFTALLLGAFRHLAKEKANGR